MEISAESIRGNTRGLLKIDYLNLNKQEEKKIWENVFLGSLCTKIQAFNLKVVHEALPTLEVIGGRNNVKFPNKFCTYCKGKFRKSIVESIEHILIDCSIARSVRHIIKDKLRCAYLNEIKIEKNIIFYKIGMGKPQSHLISEINWCLWTNRCSNVYDGTFNSHIAVLENIYYRVSLMSKIDKVLLSVKKYNAIWTGIDQAREAIQK